MTIQRQLVRLVAACVLPAALAAALLIGYSYQRQRVIVELSTLELARALAQTVDRELAIGQAALQVLALSPYLASGDLDAFYRQAQESIRYLPGDNIVLTDVGGQQQINTLRPFGDPLGSHGNLPQLRRVFETGRPAVSDLFIGGVTRRPLIAIDVPVRRGERIEFDLAMGFFPERLAQVLAREKLPPSWVVSIFDSQGTILARTHAAEQFIGKKGAPALVQRMAQVSEGRVETETLEGIPVSAVFSRSAMSGWSVAIGIPSVELARYWWIPVAWIIAGAVVLLGSGVLLAQRIGSRISGSIRGLIAPAKALGRGDPVALPPLRLQEADEVGKELLIAAERLQDREKTLAIVAHDLRSPLAALMVGASATERRAAQLPGGEPIRALAASLVETTERISGMVDDLLAISASTGGGRSLLNIARVSAASLLERATGAARILFESEGVELQIEAAGALPELRVDSDRMLRVFTNVLDNALKFTPRPGRVVLRAEAQPDAVQFCVANTGPPLSAEERERMFQPFWQAGRGDRRGAGLGLSICRSIVQAHGGTIRAEAEAGMRVRICILLPRAEPAKEVVVDAR